jgi:hypothetical protein
MRWSWEFKGKHGIIADVDLIDRPPLKEGYTYSLTPLKLFLWMGQQPNFRMASL